MHIFANYRRNHASAEVEIEFALVERRYTADEIVSDFAEVDLRKLRCASIVTCSVRFAFVCEIEHSPFRALRLFVLAKLIALTRKQ